MKDNQSSEELNTEMDSTTFEKELKVSGINEFVQKNWKMFIILSVAIIVLVGLILLFRANSQKNEQNASKALSRIETYFLNGEYENALYAPDSLPTVRGEKIIGLIKIVEEYGSTTAGERAALYAADAYYQISKFNEAKIYYEKSINSSIDDIKVGGYAGSAACSERDGKLQDASDNYLKAVALIKDDGLRLRYMYFAGLCNEKLGKKDEARKIYREVVDLNKFGEFNNMAKAGIVRLGDVIE
jgi:tetratricopeptide (TPR) repeat protein